MASMKDPVTDPQLTSTSKVVSKSKGQKQCDVKPKKKKNLLSGTTNVWHDSKNDNRCFRLRRKSPTRARVSDGCARNNKNKLRSNDNSTTPLLSECLASSSSETHRDWEKEGGKPKGRPGTALTREGIPQERLVKGDQVKKPSTKTSHTSPKVRKKHSSKNPWKSCGKNNKSLDKNLCHSSAFSKYSNSQALCPDRHSSKKKEHGKTDDNRKSGKKYGHSKRSKDLKILATSHKSGKRKHHSTSDSQSPSDESQLSPRSENCKQKNVPKHERKNAQSSQSKPWKKRSNRRVVKPEPELPPMVDTSDSDSEHPASSDLQPGIPTFMGFPMENENVEDWDALYPLAEPFSDVATARYVARPFFIEFHQRFMSRFLAAIFSQSSSDWDSDDGLNEDDDDDDDDNVQISNDNSTELDDYECYSDSSSEDSDSCCEDLLCSGRNHLNGIRIVAGDESSQPDGFGHFDSDPLTASGYDSEHSAEDTDISEDDLIYRVAEDYDQLDPLLSSLTLGIPQLSVSVFNEQLQIAQDMFHTFYENVIMTLASHPELQNDGAPPPASEETIAVLPCVVVTKDLLGDNTSCAICRSDYSLNEKLNELPCKHTFHPICIAAWLHKSGTCPVCRFHLQSPTNGET